MAWRNCKTRFAPPQGKPRLFVEAKSLGRDLGQHKWKAQAVNCANTAGVEWCVLTDGNFWQVYKSNAPGDLDGSRRGVWRVTEQGRRRAEGGPERT
ncbi:MAG: hypothetical protein ACYTFZ_08635 [Planctomycetota bacterium]